VEVDDPTFGRLKMHGVTPRLSATPGAVRRTGPALGEANAEVYGGLLGRPTAQLETLRAAGVI
jgi:crotonobetainyl-CoA:carnitine CoA-transferase CaiB-like acyl-CoA transferase